MNYQEKQQEERRQLHRRLAQKRNPTYSQNIWDLVKKYSVTGRVYDIYSRMYGEFIRKYGALCINCGNHFFPKWKNEVYCTECKDPVRRERNARNARNYRRRKSQESEAADISAIRQLAS